MKYLCRQTRLIFEIQAQRAGTTHPKEPEKNRTPNRLGAKEKLLWPALRIVVVFVGSAFSRHGSIRDDSAFFGPFRVISFGRRHGEPSST
jgi:hypothetical protein